jgi:hypothetical protein
LLRNKLVKVIFEGLLKQKGKEKTGLWLCSVITIFYGFFMVRPEGKNGCRGYRSRGTPEADKNYRRQ